MYPVSKEFLSAIEHGAVQHIRGGITKVNGDEFAVTEGLCGTISIETQCVTDANQFGFGGMYAGKMECGLDLPYSMKNELLGGTAVLESGVETSNGIEWIPLGIWNITGCIRNEANSIKLTCMDNLIKLQKDTEPEKLKFVGVVTVYELMRHVTKLTGVEFAQSITELSELSGWRFDTDIFTSHYGKTAWEEVSAIAQATGCFAFANRQGKIEFRRLDRTEPVIEITADQRFSAQLEEYVYSIHGVKYTDSTGFTSQKIIPGTRSGGAVPGFSDCMLVFESEDTDSGQYLYYLEKIAANLAAVSFTPGTVEYYGNPALDVGDYVKITGGTAVHSGEVSFLICCNFWQFRAPQTLTACGFSESGSDSSSSASNGSGIMQTVNVSKSVKSLDFTHYPGELFAYERTAAQLKFSCRNETYCFLECSMNLYGESTENAVISVYFDSILQTFQPVFTMRKNEYFSHHFSLPFICKPGTHTVEIAASGICGLDKISAFLWGQNISEICAENTGEEDYIYSVQNKSTTVVEYVGSSLFPEIPDALGGAPVRTIGSYSFIDSDIEYAYIPPGVTEIE